MIRKILIVAFFVIATLLLVVAPIVSALVGKQVDVGMIVLSVICASWIFTSVRGRMPARISTTFSRDGVERRVRIGLRERVRWEDLVEISISTTDDGPFVEDVWWLFASYDGTGCAVPGCEAAPIFDRMKTLADVDYAAIIRAMGSTKNALFPVWKGDRGSARVLGSISI